MDAKQIGDLVRQTLLDFTNACDENGKIDSRAFSALALATLASMRALGGEEHFRRELAKISAAAAGVPDFNPEDDDEST